LKTIDKGVLDGLARQYKKKKGDEVLSKVINVLEPMIRGKASSYIYRFEKSRGKYPMEFKDLCQEGRMVVREMLHNWNPGKSSFNTYANLGIRNTFCNIMVRRHNLKKRAVGSYAVSLEAMLYSDEVGGMRLSDKFVRVDANQEDLVAVSELSFEISRAMIEEVKDGLPLKVVKLWLEGQKISQIARRLRKPENVVRFKFNEAVKSIRKTMPVSYFEMYKSLSSASVKLIKVDVESFCN
jgi:DNA-directed RNA polymerase specialized sigma24 family protein